MKRNSFILTLMTALALMPCAKAKTLYWTGQSSDGISTTWLLGEPWSENRDAAIGDCELSEEDDLVFSSSSVDNTEALTNYDKWNDCWHPVVVHSVTFNSDVSFGFAHIELTRDDLVAEGVGTAEYYDGFGKWTSARVTWAGGTVDPGEFDCDENLSVSFSYTDMNGGVRYTKVDHVTTRTVEFELNIPNFSTYYLTYRDTPLAAIRSEAGKCADQFDTLVLNGLYGRELTLGDERDLTLEARENTLLNGENALADLRIGYNYTGTGARVEITNSLTIDGLCVAAGGGESGAVFANESDKNEVLDYRDKDVVLRNAEVSVTRAGVEAKLGTVKESSITLDAASRLSLAGAADLRGVTVSDGGVLTIRNASEVQGVSAQSVCLDGGVLGVYRRDDAAAGEGDANVGRLTFGAGQSLTVMGNSTLEADLVMAGGTLTFADNAVLTMGCSVEIGAADTVTIVLTQEMVECIAEGGRVTLFAGVDAAELGSNITFIGAEGVTIVNPHLCKLTYDEATQMIYATPEPAAATLALLALAGLTARRRRRA